MPAAPLLRVIEGGLKDGAPRLPAAREADRLVLPPIPVRERFLPFVVAVLAVHAAVIAGLMNLSLFGEPKGAGGTATIDEIEVELVDAPPSAAREVATFAPARPMTDDTTAVPPDAAPVQPVTDDATLVPAAAAPAAVASEDGGPPVVDGTAARADDDAVAQAPDAGAIVAAPVTLAHEEAASPAADEAVAVAEDDALPRTMDAGTTALTRPDAAAPDAAMAASPVADDVAEAVSRDASAEPLAAAPAIADRSSPAAKVVAEPAAKAVAEPVAKAPGKAAAKPAAPAKGAAKSGATAAGGANKALLATYYGRLSAHLRGYRSYPSEAARRRLSGRAVVSITINASGKVLGATIRKGTGHAVLDKEALAMARRASPFPAIPKDLGKSRLTFDAPVRFDPR